jgi:hypothetical protein
MSQFTDDYVRGLGMSVRNNALAYGYSITATSSFAVLARASPPASIGHVFAFVVGASIAFAAVNAIVTRGFRQCVEEEAPVVLALATSISALSISAGVGVATLLAVLVGGWPAWLVGPLVATWTYLSLSALEIALARALHLTVGDGDPHER